MSTRFDRIAPLPPLSSSIKTGFFSEPDEVVIKEIPLSERFAHARHLSAVGDMWEITTRPTFEPVFGFKPTIDSLMPYTIEQAEDLLLSRSPDEFEYRQSVVARKMEARRELEASGSWFPALALGFADPVNFVPFVGPYYRGVGIAKGAMRLGAGFGGLTAIEESILTQAIDRPRLEQVINITTATLVGGVFGGFLGRTGGRKIVQDFANKQDDLHAQYDGMSAPSKFPEKDPLSVTDINVPMKFDFDNDRLLINDNIIQKMWDTKAWANPTVKGVKPLADDVFRDRTQYERFLVEKEFAKLKFSRGSKQTEADYVNEINQTALKTMRYDEVSVNNYNGVLTPAEARRQPKGSYRISKVLGIAPAIRATKLYADDNYLAAQGMELVDLGSQIEGAANGIAKPFSLESITMARWGWAPKELHQSMERIWMRSNGRDIEGGPEYGGVQITAAAARLRDTVTRNKGENTYQAFQDIVAKRVVATSDKEFLAIAGRESDEFIDEAAAAVTKFFKEFEEQAVKTGVFGLRGDKKIMRQQVKSNSDELDNLKKKIDAMMASQERKANIVEDLETKSDGFYLGLSDDQYNLLVRLQKEIEEAAAEGGAYQRRLGAMVAKAHRLRTENVALNKRLEATVGGVKQNYYPHRFMIDVIDDNDAEFRGVIKQHFIENPQTVVFSEKNNRWYVNDKDPATLDARVDATIANIKQEARLAGFDGTLIPERIGSGLRFLNSRTLDIPTEKLVGIVNRNGESINFIDTNVRAMAELYSKRVGSQIEMARKFGDRFGMGHREELAKYIDENYIMPVLKKLENKSLKPAERKALQETLKKEQKAKQDYLDNLLDVQHKALHQFDINDPSALTTRVAEGLRNWFTLAYGGAFVLSAMPDAARPMMVYGAKSFFKAIPEQMRDLSQYKIISKEMREVAGDLMDIVNASTLNRFVDQGELAGFGKRSGFERALTAAQGPFFIANLLGPWTYQWKMFTGLMAGHMMIKYSKELVAGTIGKHGKETLSMMGIDMNLARKILEQPFEQNGKTYLLNSAKWTDEALRTRVSAAVARETRRVMVQPTIGDKPNIMSGIFRTNNKVALGIAQSKAFKSLGFNVVGNKISHPGAALPFQFMSWPISAMSKVTGEALQRRDAAAFFGAMGMVSMGYFSGMLKHYNWWEMDFDQQMVRAVELSGVGALFTDFPLMMEEMTGGEYGLRAMLGHESLYDRDENDAIGRVFGASVGGTKELYDAFFDADMRLDKRSAIVRRATPFAGLFYLRDISRFMERNALRPLMGTVYDD